MDDTAAAIAEQPAEAPDVRAQISLVRLAGITPSATNPRRRFNQAQLDELTDSVRQHGVLQPILVRPIVGSEDRFELVCGERRYRAAMAAELREVPALVRPLTDLQVLEVQLIENLQREGLHELEEAEGYERLIATHGYSVDDLAAKVGKSRSYVYQRMKLTDLGDRARKAFYAGKLTFITALLIARIPSQDLQVQALKEITEHWQGGMSARQAADHIQRRYMLRLHDASFPKHDAQLVPSAGACSTCPKRTGNSPDLFGDVESADVCTDPSCFDSKREAHKRRMAEQAKQQGREVITGKKAADRLRQDFVELDDKDYHLTGSGKTYKQLLGKAAPPAVLIENARGELVEALPKKAVVEALKEKGHKVSTSSRPVQEVEREKKAKAESAYRAALLTHLIKRIVERKHFDLMPVIDAMWGRALHDTKRRFCAFKGWGEHEVLQRAQAMNQEDRYLLLMELSLAGELQVSPSYESKATGLLELAKVLEFDAAALRREMAAQARAAEKAKKAPKGEQAPAPTKAARRTNTAPPTAAERAAHPPERLAAGDTVKVRSREALLGRTPHFRKTLPGLVGKVLESFVDGRLRIKFGAEHQHKAVWLMAHEVERIEPPASVLIAGIDVQRDGIVVANGPTEQCAVGDRVKVRRDAKSSTGSRLKMVNREGVVTVVNGAQLVVDFGNRTYGKRVLSIDQVERIKAAAAEGAQP